MKRMWLPLACWVMLSGVALPASAACTSLAVAVPNTAVLTFSLLHKTRRTATFSIAFDTHTAAPVAYPQAGLAIKLFLDGRQFRQVMFPLASSASFIADYPAVKPGHHEFAAQLVSDGGRLIQSRSRCMLFR